MKNRDAEAMRYPGIRPRPQVATASFYRRNWGTNSSEPVPVGQKNTLLRIAPVDSYTEAKEVSVGF